MVKVKDGVIAHAIGDAFGVPVEFVEREELLKHPITTMKGDGSHYMPKGFFSDDTSMSLALMDSYIRNKKFDYNDIMDSFVNWINKGKYTPGGKAFDVGSTCLNAIKNYAINKLPPLECGINEFSANGNGSLMRILPLAYYFYYKKTPEEEIYTLTKNISSLTHSHEISIMACFIYINYVLLILKGKDKYSAYNMLRLVDYSMFSKKTREVFNRILKSDIRKLNINEIKSTGYVVDTLEASLWVILNAKNYKEAIIGAVNLGGDTDTIGAITGSMAGIIYGYESIPEKWKETLVKKDYIEDLCEKYEQLIKEK